MGNYIIILHQLHNHCINTGKVTRNWLHDTASIHSHFRI